MSVNVEASVAYQLDRHSLIIGGEGFRQAVYFDTVGIPKIDKWLALVIQAYGATGPYQSRSNDYKIVEFINF